MCTWIHRVSTVRYPWEIDNRIRSNICHFIRLPLQRKGEQREGQRRRRGRYADLSTAGNSFQLNLVMRKLVLKMINSTGAYYRRECMDIVYASASAVLV